MVSQDASTQNGGHESQQIDRPHIAAFILQSFEEARLPIAIRFLSLPNRASHVKAASFVRVCS
jgi:hypothetical protein